MTKKSTTGIILFLSKAVGSLNTLKLKKTWIILTNPSVRKMKIKTEITKLKNLQTDNLEVFIYIEL
jgi:hypothetical protein